MELFAFHAVLLVFIGTTLPWLTSAEFSPGCLMSCSEGNLRCLHLCERRQASAISRAKKADSLFENEAKDKFWDEKPARVYNVGAYEMNRFIRPAFVRIGKRTIGLLPVEEDNDLWRRRRKRDAKRTDDTGHDVGNSKDIGNTEFQTNETTSTENERRQKQAKNTSRSRRETSGTEKRGRFVRIGRIKSDCSDEQKRRAGFVRIGKGKEEDWVEPDTEKRRSGFVRIGRKTMNTGCTNPGVEETRHSGIGREKMENWNDEDVEKRPGGFIRVGKEKVENWIDYDEKRDWAGQEGEKRRSGFVRIGRENEKDEGYRRPGFVRIGKDHSR